MAASSLPARTETGQTNVVDNIVTNVAGDYYVGDTGPFNVLVVTNAGTLNDDTGYIGNAADAANNAAVVHGAGSVWNHTNRLYVGDSGWGNSLAILDGGRASRGQQHLRLRRQGRARHRQFRDHHGDRFNLGGRLVVVVGEKGANNRLTISDGGVVGPGAIGYDPSGTNNATP